MPSRPHPEAHLDLETLAKVVINIIDNPEEAINLASNPDPAQDAEDPKEQN